MGPWPGIYDQLGVERQDADRIRNIARLGVWMAMAQCFAGPPEPPPAPGSRYMAK